MAEILDVSETFFDRKYRPLTHDNDVSYGLGSDKGKLFFRSRGVIDAYVADELLRQEPVAPSAGDDGVVDPLLEGESTPSLEEYRKHRARQEKVKADMAERLAVSVEEIRPLLLKGANIMRQSIHRLQQQFGNAASDIVNEGIDQMEEAWHNAISGSIESDADLPASPEPARDDQQAGNGHDCRDASAAPADDAAVRGAGDEAHDGQGPGPALPS
jgi:hypothetical protein